ncbi:hypothetical protein NPIL_315131 [Nephila pilipes]|uniref:Uncharacterized protein n=1 Tax=Nephila pilipes TaxID=299642 RepID=A0A8X6UFS1_NEPPI|nr:hypothetical protein NPIL_315131 [Nephila pilipes]
MECNNSRPSSPSLTQDKETCETLRLMNERLRILKMQHEDTYSHVCHIESRYMDRESDFYKGAYGLYLAAKEAAEGEYLSFPKCPIPGCPLHTQLPITPEKRSKTINFDNEGFQTPPLKNKQKGKLLSNIFLK